MINKKRVELRFDEKKDKGIICFLESEVDNKAGFIKTLVRDYVRYRHSITHENKANLLTNKRINSQITDQQTNVNDNTQDVSQFLMDFFHRYS
ncbi:hypothetical protein [Virgibacillus sp. DJP39]|uniref:hypothetical protein n=1 Tax=Virgibacillus sp. DJP39 TaxID=3409790 RepID=UPI003BB6F29C